MSKVVIYGGHAVFHTVFYAVWHDSGTYRRPQSTSQMATEIVGCSCWTLHESVLVRPRLGTSVVRAYLALGLTTLGR